MDLNEIICVTTFRQGDPNNLIEKIRTEVFLDTARKMQQVGLSFAVIYTDTQERILDDVRKLGVTLVKQQSTGMGNIRREALTAASSQFPGARYLCWSEPEKPDIVRFVPPIVHQMEREGAALGLFNRRDMASYPSEQAHYYLFCRSVATHLLGFDTDYAFGPMVVSVTSIRYFLEYQGEYGDEWDSILVPRVRIIKDGHPVSILPIDFQNDPRMTNAEKGNPDVILKRLKQFNNVVPSLISEWQRLHGS